MKALLRSIFRKLFFKNRAPREYPAVRITNENVIEKVILKFNNQSVDITKGHAVVCQTPFYLALWVEAEHITLCDSDLFEIEIQRNNECIAKLQALRHQVIRENDLHIAILKLVQGRSYLVNYLHQQLLISYFVRKRKITFLEGAIYGASYSFPRRVIVVSYREQDYYNIFPMDFQCDLEEKGLFFFGLRTTNITLQKILTTKKLVVSNTDSIDLSTIYALGKHHSSKPPATETLPFKTTESELFEFPVPAFSSAYKEIEVITNFPLGSHTFFIGRVLNSKKSKKESSSIYHFHFFGSLGSSYPQLEAK